MATTPWRCRLFGHRVKWWVAPPTQHVTVTVGDDSTIVPVYVCDRCHQHVYSTIDGPHDDLPARWVVLNIERP